MQFIDPKSRYRAMQEQIDDRIVKIVNHAQFIVRLEIREMEARLKAYVGARHFLGFR